MKMQEQSVKVVYRDREPIGCWKMVDGTLKFYKWAEASYTDVDELFDVKDA